MSRSLRIEYPNAFYHVMNRGAGRQAIFHIDDGQHHAVKRVEVKLSKDKSLRKDFMAVEERIQNSKTDT